MVHNIPSENFPYQGPRTFLAINCYSEASPLPSEPSNFCPDFQFARFLCQTSYAPGNLARWGGHRPKSFTSQKLTCFFSRLLLPSWDWWPENSNVEFLASNRQNFHGINVSWKRWIDPYRKWKLYSKFNAYMDKVELKQTGHAPWKMKVWHSHMRLV